MILFPSHPSFPRQPDPSFEEEIEAAKAAGFKIGLVDVDQKIFAGSQIPCLYRGWIMTPDGYIDLWHKEPKLIINPGEYENSYNFPAWYNQVRAFDNSLTPRSVSHQLSPNIPISDIFDQLEEDSWYEALTGPVIVKDWVKSRKHEWFDACYISDIRDKAEFKRVVTNFLNGQGDDLAGGLVFREFVKLKSIGVHPQSKMPLTNEHRFFVFKGRIFYSAPYWDRSFYGTSNLPDKKVIIDLVPHIKSNFFAIDVAEKEDGGWIVVEVNDGGTASVPDGGNIAEFYLKLRVVLAMTKKEERELTAIIQDAWKLLERPGCDSQQIPDYLHIKSGNEYEITSVALRESDLMPLVIYRRKGHTVQFARSIYEFLEKFRSMG
ncbi:ATP-grasp domain-containing protein [Candidatus Pacearchaeota archaeon]|jgi:hypothetical protein|nr:ATP-grasp domain-containing protein [Candidatus Pacearchaeota archaeon]